MAENLITESTNNGWSFSLCEQGENCFIMGTHSTQKSYIISPSLSYIKNYKLTFEAKSNTTRNTFMNFASGNKNYEYATTLGVQINTHALELGQEWETYTVYFKSIYNLKIWCNATHECSVRNISIEETTETITMSPWYETFNRCSSGHIETMHTGVTFVNCTAVNGGINVGTATKIGTISTGAIRGDGIKSLPDTYVVTFKAKLITEGDEGIINIKNVSSDKCQIKIDKDLKEYTFSCLEKSPNVIFESSEGECFFIKDITITLDNTIPFSGVLCEPQYEFGAGDTCKKITFDTTTTSLTIDYSSTINPKVLYSKSSTSTHNNNLQLMSCTLIIYEDCNLTADDIVNELNITCEQNNSINKIVKLIQHGASTGSTNAIFYETFDNCNGTTGFTASDDLIIDASSKTKENGWIFKNVFEKDGAIHIGEKIYKTDYVSTGKIGPKTPMLNFTDYRRAYAITRELGVNGDITITCKVAQVKGGINALQTIFVEGPGYLNTNKQILPKEGEWGYTTFYVKGVKPETRIQFTSNVIIDSIKIELGIPKTLCAYHHYYIERLVVPANATTIGHHGWYVNGGAITSFITNDEAGYGKMNFKNNSFDVNTTQFYKAYQTSPYGITLTPKRYIGHFMLWQAPMGVEILQDYSYGSLTVISENAYLGANPITGVLSNGNNTGSSSNTGSNTGTNNGGTTGGNSGNISTGGGTTTPTNPTIPTQPSIEYNPPVFEEEATEVIEDFVNKNTTERFFDSHFTPHSFEPNGSLTDESTSYSVMNSKVMKITFYGQNKDYIIKSVLPYLRQMIPSTTILMYTFYDRSTGKAETDVVVGLGDDENILVDGFHGVGNSED